MVSLLVRATATLASQVCRSTGGLEPADIELFSMPIWLALAADSARYRRYLRGVRSE